MNRNFILIILLILFLSACQNSENRVPEGVLSKSKMIEVLTEVYILEASINHENISVGIKNQYNSVHYDELFKRLEVNKVSFDTSLVFYKKDLKIFKEIHDSIYNNLEQMKLEFEKEEPEFTDK